MSVTVLEKTVTRKTISAKARFEVFKRDGFTCLYCNRKTPNVVLEVDHIIPVAEGGANEMENLATSCWECNRGKGASLLDDRAPIPDIHDQAILMLEREMQLREYNAVREMVREREDADVDALLEYWYGLYPNGGKYAPYIPMLRSALRRLPKADIMDAMEMAESYKPSACSGVKYFAGILRRLLDQQGAA